MTNPDQVPVRVQELAQDIRAKLSIEPVVEFVGKRWRVSVITERVTAIAEYKRSSGGRWFWCDGKLLVDGQLRPVADNLTHLKRIIADPDGRKIELDPMPPVAAITDAPAVVQRDYWLIARRIGQDFITVGHTWNRWVISLDKPGAVLRMRYAKRGQLWVNDHRRPWELVVDGRDRTDEVTDLANAMALLLDQSEPGEQGESAVGGPASGARANSVEVRRHSVIRN